MWKEHQRGSVSSLSAPTSACMAFQEPLTSLSFPRLCHGGPTAVSTSQVGCLRRCSIHVSSNLRER